MTRALILCLQVEFFMLRNPVSYIFKLGKHRSLPLQPLRQFSAKTESPLLPLPTPLTMQEVPAKTRQSQHSNQMSS